MSDRSLYMGIMTGTSLDAIDVALCRFLPASVEIHGFTSIDWPPALRDILMDLATADTVSLDILARTNFLLARAYAEAVQAALAEARVSAGYVRAIGLHGQTIRHIPRPVSERGLAAIGATLQWGSGPAVAALTGIDVVHDFRSADVAVGGQGAPLVPMFDYGFLRSDKVDRLVTNIGGISNVTWLPAGASRDDVVAFDCGPGNMLIDSITRTYLGDPYDANGAAARSGSIDDTLLTTLISHPYFRELPPKSTGRELFGEAFLEPVHRAIHKGTLQVEDALATLTELTARSIASALGLVGHKDGAVEIIVSGGGARNAYLLERIAANARAGSRVTTSDEFGVPVQAKESIAFAYFAKAFIEEIPIHLPLTTGASRSVVLGSLSKGTLTHSK